MRQQQQQAFSVLDYGAAADGLRPMTWRRFWRQWRHVLPQVAAWCWFRLAIMLSVGVALATQYIDVPANCNGADAWRHHHGDRHQRTDRILRVPHFRQHDDQCHAGWRSADPDRASGDLSGETGFGVAIRSGANDAGVGHDDHRLCSAMPSTWRQYAGGKRGDSRLQTTQLPTQQSGASCTLRACWWQTANSPTPTAPVRRRAWISSQMRAATITDVQIVNCHTTGNAGSGLNIISGVAGAHGWSCGDPAHCGGKLRRNRQHRLGNQHRQCPMKSRLRAASPTAISAALPQPISARARLPTSRQSQRWLRNLY